MFFPFLVNDDPTVYFTIAKNIVLSHHWLSLTDSHGAWLDKPHLPFWLTAVSFKLFGFHAWSYILPGFLFYMLGAFYTYKIARLFYTDETVALFSVLIYVTILRLMLSSLDV
jgi:4-amino-4-deoxy-L-arabinose transferase-like glycosyltransferase